jgi:predicted RecA/RadA family phage recombinase
MTSKYIQEGEVLNYVATADTPVNSIVKAGTLLGIALTDIKAGQTGSVLLEGVFEVPKASAAVFAQGDTVLFDPANKNFKVGDGGANAVAFEAAAAGETTCKVLFTGVPGKP